jgi:hypothetical protein
MHLRNGASAAVDRPGSSSEPGVIHQSASHCPVGIICAYRHRVASMICGCGSMDVPGDANRRRHLPQMLNLECHARDGMQHLWPAWLVSRLWCAGSLASASGLMDMTTICHRQMQPEPAIRTCRTSGLFCRFPQAQHRGSSFHAG